MNGEMRKRNLADNDSQSQILGWYLGDSAQIWNALYRHRVDESSSRREELREGFDEHPFGPWRRVGNAPRSLHSGFHSPAEEGLQRFTVKQTLENFLVSFSTREQWLFSCSQITQFNSSSNSEAVVEVVMDVVESGHEENSKSDPGLRPTSSGPHHCNISLMLSCTAPTRSHTFIILRWCRCVLPSSAHG